MSSSQAPRFGADTMLFIYHFEGNQEFGASAGRILSAAEAGRCHLVVSSLAVMEVLVVPKRLGAVEICQRYLEFFRSFPHLEIVSVDQDVAEIAAALRADHGISTPDALHVASALHAGASAFLTEDRKLKNLPTLPVLGLAEAIGEIPAVVRRR